MSAAVKAAEEFWETLDKLSLEENHLPEQIFSMDETFLFRKQMPESTFIHKETKAMPGFKAFKDWMTVLLEGKVAGYKLKPFVIWHSENPRGFKHINIHTLGQCIAGDISRGWPSSSFKMLSWIDMPAKLRSSIERITYPSSFCLLSIISRCLL